MVREVKRKQAFQYIKKAEEFHASSLQNMENARFNAAGFDAIQSMINANDALTVYFLEKRASRDHREAIKYHLDVVKITNDSSQRGRLKDALDLRSNVGYVGAFISKRDAGKIVRSATQFISWVKKYLK